MTHWDSDRHLRGFEEAEIGFAPTYKYATGSSEFDDSAKQRVPSYTDRVLWKQRRRPGHGVVVCRHYDSVPQVQSSDHRAVWAAFDVTVRPGRDTGPLAAGSFNRSVYVEGLKRRVQAWDPAKPLTSHHHNGCSLQ